jgi:hypothetical protein
VGQHGTDLSAAGSPSCVAQCSTCACTSDSAPHTRRPLRAIATPDRAAAAVRKKGFLGNTSTRQGKPSQAEGVPAPCVWCVLAVPLYVWCVRPRVGLEAKSKEQQAVQQATGRRQHSTRETHGHITERRIGKQSTEETRCGAWCPPSVVLRRSLGARLQSRAAC